MSSAVVEELPDDGQNTTPSTKPGRGAGLRPPWQPGQSGNPGGRPKGLAAKIRELAPPEKLAAFYLAIAERDGKKLRALGIKVSEVGLADRMKAADWLADRGYGKAPMHALVDGGDPLELDAVDTAIASVLGQLDTAREKKAARESGEGPVAGAGAGGAASA